MWGFLRMECSMKWSAVIIESKSIACSFESHGNISTARVGQRVSARERGRESIWHETIFTPTFSRISDDEIDGEMCSAGTSFAIRKDGPFAAVAMTWYGWKSRPNDEWQLLSQSFKCSNVNEWSSIGRDNVIRCSRECDGTWWSVVTVEFE